MSTRKVPPPPPESDLSPFEVGAYLAGHVPEYVVHSFQVGGLTQSERIEAHRRFLSPEAFAAWLETEDAKRVDVDPVRVVECPGFGGSMTIEQDAEAWAEIGKPPGIQAAHLEAVKENRKAKATTAKKVATLPNARAAKKERQEARDQDVLSAALETLSSMRGNQIGWTVFADAVGAWLQDPPVEWLKADETRKAWSNGTSRSSICERLERVKNRLPMERFGPWKKGSGD